MSVLQRHCWLLGLCVSLLSTTFGCAARQVRLAQKGMTCTEAENLAVVAVQKMGYKVKETTRPSAAGPGSVKGEREIATGNVHRVLVQVLCTSLGAEVEAKAESGMLDDLNFANQFKEAFDTAAEVKKPAREPSRTGVDVLLSPERAAGGDLGIDLSGTGIMPVFIRITNHSPRRYRFKVAEVVLQHADRTRVHSLPWSEVAAKAPPASVDTLQAKLAKDADLKPGEALSGYLYFPFAGYANARVTLEDVESKEDEGFFIEF
ncbi:MAG: hypothetical protein HY270_06990 [Deltaproteobacteria bacterium]|nr:hypothetical protein [Deltaproteobacteria bacterium]